MREALFEFFSTSPLYIKNCLTFMITVRFVWLDQYYLDLKANPEEFIIITIIIIVVMKRSELALVFSP